MLDTLVTGSVTTTLIVTVPEVLVLLRVNNPVFSSIVAIFVSEIV
jgi:hypothetical protein